MDLRAFVVFASASLLFLSVGAAGCAASSEEVDDDGNPIEDPVGTIGDELVSERQLRGNELGDKRLSLTFDDGPGPRTGELADWLANRGIEATFFINGMKVPGRQLIVDTIVARGHLLANHTQNHRRLTSLSATRLIDEVEDTDAIIEAEQPRGPWILRAPFGAWNAAVTKRINATPMKKYVGSVFWDVGGALTATSAADWACWGQGVTVARCGNLYMNEIQTRRKGIVLMHDIHGRTIDMVKAIVPKLEAQGYRFVPLTAVPSVKRAIAGNGTGFLEGCQSATLGTTVRENTCVQSRNDEKWYRCVDSEWLASAGPADTRCIARHPLP